MQVKNLSAEFLKGGSVGPLLLLAHGAGAPMNSEFMDRLSHALISSGVRVWRFEFNYMAARHRDGRKRPPPRAPVLLEEWRSVLAQVQGQPVFIGGKSLGGRMASMLCAEPVPAEVKGCLCFGYPFHPPSKPESWRTSHFSTLSVPTWIAQGERDTFGRRERVEVHMESLSPPSTNPRIEWVTEADHDLKPLKKSPVTWEGCISRTATAAAAFMHRHS